MYHFHHSQYSISVAIKYREAVSLFPHFLGIIFLFLYCTFQTVSSGRLIVTRDVPLGSPVIGSQGCVMRDGEPIGWAIMFESRRRERALALRHVLRTWDAPVSLGNLLWRSYSIDMTVTRTS